MNEADKNYELELFKMMINKYLDESTSCTEKSFNELETKRDQVTWDLASKIYKQSGHKIEFILVRDIVNSRIKAIRYQLEQQAEEARRIAEAEAEEARRIAEEKEARILKLDPQFLSKVADVLGDFGGDKRKAEVFIRVRKIISDQLSLEERAVSWESHLSNHLNADHLDLIELVMALEEEFEIEIPDEIAEEFLGIQSDLDGSFLGTSISFPSSGWGSPSSSSSYSAGKQCIVKNFVEFIHEKVFFA